MIDSVTYDAIRWNCDRLEMLPFLVRRIYCHGNLIPYDMHPVNCELNEPVDVVLRYRLHYENRSATLERVTSEREVVDEIHHAGRVVPLVPSQ